MEIVLQGKDKRCKNAPVNLCTVMHCFFSLSCPWQADGLQDGYSSAYGYVGYSSLRVVDFPTLLESGQVRAQRNDPESGSAISNQI
jgi:hypothetical protein